MERTLEGGAEVCVPVQAGWSASSSPAPLGTSWSPSHPARAGSWAQSSVRLMEAGLEQEWVAAVGLAGFDQLGPLGECC